MRTLPLLLTLVVVACGESTAPEIPVEVDPLVVALSGSLDPGTVLPLIVGDFTECRFHNAVLSQDGALIRTVAQVFHCWRPGEAP